MDQERLDEYYKNVKVMADTFYDLGELVMKGMAQDTVLTLLNLDLISFLLYLCEDGKPNKDEIKFVQEYTKIDMPPEHWNHLVSDLDIDITVPGIPKTFDLFIRVDEQLGRQGRDSCIGGLFITIYQTLGVGIESSDRIINKKELDKLKAYITNLKKYYQKNYKGNTPLEVDPIDPELIKRISYSTDDEYREVPVLDSIDDEYGEMPVMDSVPQKETKYFDVRFMGKAYKVPEDAVTFIKTREFVGKELIKLINVASDMIVRYSDTKAPMFFENFNDEIKRYQSVMLEACQDIVDDFISRDIYDVSVTDFAGKLSGFDALKELGNKVIRKANSEMQKIIDAKEAGKKSAYKSAANTITGSGLRIFTNSFASLMVYSAVEKHIMLSQAKKADKQYEKAVKKIQAACKDVLNQVCTNILINDFGYGLVEIIENFNHELMQNYLLELVMHGQFNTDNILEYSENKSNAILENMGRVADNKKKLLVEAYKACPFNIDVYDKMLKMGYFDVNTLKDAIQIFPVETLRSMVEENIESSSNPIKKMGEYVSVLTYYDNTDEKTVIKKYFATHAGALIVPYENIKVTCGNLHQFDLWVRKYISGDMNRIVAINDDSIYEKAENWLSHQVDSSKIIKLCNAGINPFDGTQTSNNEAISYDDIKKEYTDLLARTLKKYIYEARNRKKLYEQAYEKYNADREQCRKTIEELNSELEKTGFFSFSKKKELKEKIANEQETLDKIKEPVGLKRSYYDMYK